MKFLSPYTSIVYLGLKLLIFVVLIFIVFEFAPFESDGNMEMEVKNDTEVEKMILDCECGRRNANGRSVTGRIVGGEDTLPYEFPWLVFVVVTKRILPRPGYTTCGASIINDRILLTGIDIFFQCWIPRSAHCVYNDDDHDNRTLLPPDYLRAVFHTYRARNETKTYNVSSTDKPFYDFKLSRVIPHPGYPLNVSKVDENDVFLNDLALLVLEKRLDILNPIFTPVCFPQKDDKITLFPGKFATLAGWGRIFRGNKTHKSVGADKSQKLQIPLQSDELCAKLIPGKQLSKFICGDAGDQTGGAPGDSGGPLTIELPSKQLLQVGIVSHGKDDNTTSIDFARISFYTKITEYLDWIEKESAPYQPKTCERKSNPT